MNRRLRLRRPALPSPHRLASAPAKTHDCRSGTAAPTAPWATDGTKQWTVNAGWLEPFTTIGQGNAECLGHPACTRRDRFAAGEPVTPAVTHGFGSRAIGAARGVALRPAHGSHHPTEDGPSQSHFPGFPSSFALVGEPAPQGVVKCFSRTHDPHQPRPQRGPPCGHSPPLSPPSSSPPTATGVSRDSATTGPSKPAAMIKPPPV
jgi:hypothetical protein